LKEYIEGMVVEVENDEAKVRAKLHSDCISCGICEGDNAIYYLAKNKIEAKIGQNVVVELEKQNVLKISLIIFIVPLFIILGSSVLGIYLAESVHVLKIFTIILINFFTLTPYIVLVRKYDHKVQNKSDMPIIIKFI